LNFLKDAFVFQDSEMCRATVAVDHYGRKSFRERYFKANSTITKEQEEKLQQQDNSKQEASAAT
jgi:hypothetical protein